MYRKILFFVLLWFTIYSMVTLGLCKLLATETLLIQNERSYIYISIIINNGKGLVQSIMYICNVPVQCTCKTSPWRVFEVKLGKSFFVRNLKFMICHIWPFLVFRLLHVVNNVFTYVTCSGNEHYEVVTECWFTKLHLPSVLLLFIS